MEFIQSEKGTSMYIDGNYIFRRNGFSKLDDQLLFWRCSKRSNNNANNAIQAHERFRGGNAWWNATYSTLFWVGLNGQELEEETLGFKHPLVWNLFTDYLIHLICFKMFTKHK